MRADTSISLTSVATRVGGTHLAACEWEGRAAEHQIRSLVLCVDLVGSRRIWAAHVGGPSIWTDPDGSRRIVWMIKRMIKEAG